MQIAYLLESTIADVNMWTVSCEETKCSIYEGISFQNMYSTVTMSTEEQMSL